MVLEVGLVKMVIKSDGCATATGALSGSAAVTMVICFDGCSQPAFKVKIPEMHRAFSLPVIQPELLIEVAVVYPTFPIDADCIAAHQSLNGTGIEVFQQ